MRTSHVRSFVFFLLVLGVQSVTLGDASAGTSFSARERICLNGAWLVHLGGDEWQVPEQGYQRCLVPGKIGGEWWLEFDGNDGGHRCGWYRLDFAVPRWWQGRRITLEFLRACSYAKVFLDGHVVGDHPDGNTPFSVDLTGRAIPGQLHRLHVFVQGWSRFREGKHRGIWPIGFNRQTGLAGDVHLSCFSPVYVEDAFVMTRVESKSLTMRVWIRNTTRVPQQLSLASSVQLGAEEVFALPDIRVDLAAGQLKMVELRRRWEDPMLWGYPPYGTPILYHLKCTLKNAGGQVIDRRFTRFGFREFRIEAGSFYLNGRPVFLQGDMAQFYSMALYPQNRQWLMQYFRALRAANVNAIRLPHGVFWPIWAQVADEVGMMLEIEPMDGVPTPGHGSDLVSGADVLAGKAAESWLQGRSIRAHIGTIDRWVREWRNHPSVIMWSTDNESGSQSGLADPGNFAVQKLVKELILSLDPTRPVAHEGSPLTSVAKRMGVDLVPDVYNIHPYSDPITVDVEKNKKRHFYSGQPVVIGELFNDFAANFNVPLREDPADKWARMKTFADYWYHNILAAKKAEYDGTFILCLGSGGFYGYVGEGEFTEGPFGQRCPIPMTWPSVSGLDPKVQNYPVRQVFDGINWFDGSRPTFTPNHAFQRVRQAYGEIAGGDLPPLPATRSPELIVTLRHRGNLVPDAYLLLVPLDGQPMNSQGVRTDANGTAWFHPSTEGHYRVTHRHRQAAEHMDVQLTPGPFDGKPGYHHVMRATFDLDTRPDIATHNEADGLPSREDDVVWKCLPLKQERPKSPLPEGAAHTVNLENAFSGDGQLSENARIHDLRLFLRGGPVDPTKLRRWSGSVAQKPHARISAFSLFMPCPQPGDYDLVFHKASFSPERSINVFVGDEKKPRILLKTNAPDLGFEFSVAPRDAAFGLKIDASDIKHGQVQLRFEAASWSTSTIRAMTLRPARSSRHAPRDGVHHAERDDYYAPTVRRSDERLKALGL